MLSMDEILMLENYPILTKPWDSPCLICDYLEQFAFENISFSQKIT
ncbi:hypothetical protein [Candidatus Hodarchaeum mangrovi]